MSDYNNGTYGGCFGGWEIIVLLLFFAMMGGNNGWGNGWGGNNNAAETAALVQQDGLRQLASQTKSTLDWNTQLTGGLVQAAERIGDKVDRNHASTQQLFGRLDTELCQLGNNISNMINATNTNIDSKFCATNQHIDGIKDQILGYMTQQQIQALQQQNSDLKVALATQSANCAREADTRAILAAIQNGQSGGGCHFGGVPFNGGFGFCGNGSYYNTVIASLATMNQSLAGIAQTQNAQGTTLSSILTRVNQIPTTAAAA